MVIFRKGWSDVESVDEGSGRAKLGQDGSRELVTVMDCISADGDVLPPFIIMKGQRISFGWAKDSELDRAWFASSPTGWIDSELNLEWLKKCFEPLTRDKAAGDWRALVFDNHKSHLSTAALQFCLDNRIICCGLPPKTSGVLQPLDVSCFRPLQKAYGEIVSDETRNAVAIGKQDFAR